MTDAARLKFILAALVVVCAPQFVRSYEVTTHARISNAAMAASVVGIQQETMMGRLGLAPFVFAPATSVFPLRTRFGDFYFEFNQTNGQVFARATRDYEHKLMPKIGPLLNPEAFRLNGWLMRGTIREDDGGLATSILLGMPINDAPFGAFDRFCNHFYDPVSAPRPGVGRGLSKPCPIDSPIQDAAQWALASQDPFQVQPAEDTARRNHFSVRDAREAMWRALTLIDRAGNSVPRFGYTAEEVRKGYWATTFHSLGSVLHLIQDMGQPQHTRNESHGTSPSNDYEKHVDQRAVRAMTRHVDSVTLQVTVSPLPDLTFIGYPIPRFNRYSDYWSTRRTLGPPSLFGLADYSNRGFFTADSNVGNTTYPEPSSEGLQVERQPFGTFPGVTFSHVYGFVEDRLTGANDRISMSTQGVFAGLGGTPPPNAPLYTFSTTNFDDRAALLIPRAVAYSAGIIDYFFRGRLEISLPDEGVYGIVDHKTVKSITTTPPQGFGRIRLKVKNITADIPGNPADIVAKPQNMNGGKLVAVAKFHRNTCYTEDLSGEWGAPGRGDAAFTQCRAPLEEILVSNIQDNVQLMANAAAQDFEFTFFPPIPINATDVYLQVVYRGSLGTEEDAVVVETKDIGEPAFTTYLNATEYVFCASGQFTRRDPTDGFPPPEPLTNVRIAYDPYSPNPGGDPLVEVGALPPHSLIRYATLGDWSRNWRVTVNIQGLPQTTNHSIHPNDPRVSTNQVYYRPNAAPANFSRLIAKIPYNHTAFGKTYYLSDGTACPATFPDDDQTRAPPEILPITINGRFGAP